MALMVEQVRHDLIECPLPVAELHIAGRRYGVELSVGQLGKKAEGVASSGEPIKQARTIDILGTVGSAVCAVGMTISVAAGSKK
jgi:hypothetical protein